MGSFIELNDTLEITEEQGFPSTELNLDLHNKKQLNATSFKNKVFELHNKLGARLYHPAPNRCFLVQNINGKWLYWGKIIVIEQTITSENKESQKTSGKFKIIEIYDPEYQRQITKHETDPGLGYF